MSNILQKDNPFRELRLHHNLSQKKLAEFADLSPQVVLLSEFGVYHLPNPKILAFFESLGETSSRLSESYQAFRQLKRNQALLSVASPENPFLGLNLSGDPPKPGFFDVNSLRVWVRFKNQFALSTVGFCKAVCLQPSIVGSFESSLYARNWNFIKEWLWPE